MMTHDKIFDTLKDIKEEIEIIEYLESIGAIKEDKLTTIREYLIGRSRQLITDLIDQIEAIKRNGGQ